VTHLHVHTEYSLLDAICRIPELVAKAKSLGQHSLAITDHGTLGGVVEFWKECRAQRVKPILGCEAYVEAGDKDYHHLTLLCQDASGFQNLVALNNLAADFFYRKPRMRASHLAEHRQGLIVLSGCLEGRLPQSIVAGTLDVEFHRWCVQTFGDYYFLEVMDTGVPEQKLINKALLTLDPRRCVATGDVHYVERIDEPVHQVALGVKYNKPITDPSTKYRGGGYYLKSEEEMLQVLPALTVSKTDWIAEMVEEYEIGNSEWAMPQVDLDEDEEQELLFRRLDALGLYDLQEYKDRLWYELEVISKNGFLPYFKIIAELCAHIDSLGRFRGWGRGSVSGSLVAYLYGITKIDPLKWKLFFERFLNPDRITPPDIDLDFMPDDRAEAIRFMSKYGNVLQVGTYGTLGTREVIKTAAKAMGVQTSLDRYVPEAAPIPTIAELLKNSKGFCKQVEYEGNRRFIEVLLRLEGLKRNESIHPAGIVLSDGRLPIKESRSGINQGKRSTSWDMYSLEDLKYVKFDILGVTNLEVVDRVCRAIGLKVDDIPPEDEPTMRMIRECRTTGVFQWESDGYRNVIRRLEPTGFEHLMDLNTLYRPGPLESGLTTAYIERRHGRQPITQIHPKLKMEHYGLPLYQEDIMSMARDLAGFSLAEADILRKAIGKKEKESFVVIRNQFIEGCMGFSAMTPEEALHLWEMVEKFARYTWNKAHAVAYTLISWWTAYLACHHAAEFFCELLNKAESAGRRRVLMSELRQREITIRPPDINLSQADFAVTEGDLVVGLRGIRQIGEKTLEKILKDREKNGPFGTRTLMGEDLDLKERTKVNVRAIQSLQDAGALLKFGMQTTSEKMREALGYSIEERLIEKVWWWKSCEQLAEVIDIHKITTKRGDPMAFLSVENRDGLMNVTVFPNLWEPLHEVIRVGTVGLFLIDSRKVLQRFALPEELGELWIQVLDGNEFLSFFPSLVGEPNVFVDRIGIARIEMTDEMMRFVEEEFGLERVMLRSRGGWYAESGEGAVRPLGEAED